MSSIKEKELSLLGWRNRNGGIRAYAGFALTYVLFFTTARSLQEVIYVVLLSMVGGLAAYYIPELMEEKDKKGERIKEE